MFLHGWMMTVSSFSSVLKSAVTLISASALGFPGNLFAFQYINFTHSLLSLWTVRKLCHGSVINPSLFENARSLNLRKTRAAKALEVFFFGFFFTGSALYAGPDALVQMLVVSFMMSGFELQILQLRCCDIISSWKPSQALVFLLTWWRRGKLAGDSASFLTSRLLLPPGFVLCLSASGT